MQGPCESRGGRPGLPVLMSLMVSVEVKQHWTMHTHWSQFVPDRSTQHPRTLSSASPVTAEGQQVNVNCTTYRMMYCPYSHGPPYCSLTLNPIGFGGCSFSGWTFKQINCLKFYSYWCFWQYTRVCVHVCVRVCACAYMHVCVHVFVHMHIICI